VADLDVLGIAGSLRRDSHNRAVLRAAQELAPAGMAIRIWEGLGTIPLYDGDVEEKGMPSAVTELHAGVERAGAVLVVTPEYSQSVPGVLKNALDWAARPPGKSSFRGKVVAIAGASPGALGTARAQMDLRRILAAMGAFVVPSPEVLVSQVHQKRDPSGRLTDEATRKFLGRLLEELQRWVARLSTR
jgi:chromate reductase